jgi:ubiquinone biosynthesis protein COQ9
MTARKRTPSKKPTDERVLKQALLKAALAHVPFDGFSEKALALAAAETNIARDVVATLFPDGPLSLVEFFSESVDLEVEEILRNRDQGHLKVRERIAGAIRTRLALLRPHKEAARRAAAFLSLPPNLLLATKLVYRTVDSMWRAVGDSSTDFNFYSKRAILAGVWSATLLRWLGDRSEDETDTEEFLAARIENVMQFERLKAQAKDALAKVPSPLAFLNGLAARR